MMKKIEPIRKSALLLIYTGGTIGMKQDADDMTLKPFDFSQILEEVPEIGKFAVKIDSFSFEPPIDSSDVEPSLWQKLACLIKDKYDDYDGFIILHGTDTMAYSASALSFMLDGLTKPVIFTGSQLPIGVPRTDGRENLISAVEIASAKDENGNPAVPGGLCLLRLAPHARQQVDQGQFRRIQGFPVTEFPAARGGRYQYKVQQ